MAEKEGLIPLGHPTLEAYLDPDSGFWAISGKERLSQKVEALWKSRRQELIEKMRKYRFEVRYSTAYINPTDLCNASCPYCYLPDELKARGKSMDYGTLCQILEGLKKLDVQWVVFHGAEPLIVKEILFKAMDEFEFNYGIQTNGLLLEPSDMDFIMERKANLGVSLDSPFRDVNDKIRGTGHFKKVSEILDYMKGYPGMSVIATINRYNYPHLAEMVDFLAGKVSVILMNPVRGTSSGGRALRPPVEESAIEFIRAVERAIELSMEGQRIVIGDFANIILGIVAPTSRVLQCDISPCGGGRRFVSITADKMVYPCGEFIGMEEFALPFDVFLERTLSGDIPFMEVRERKVENIQECVSCVYRHICGAPCPGEVYSEKGSLLEKSPYCEFYKRIIDHAFTVISEGREGYVIRKEKMKMLYRI